MKKSALKPSDFFKSKIVVKVLISKHVHYAPSNISPPPECQRTPVIPPLASS